MTSKNKKQIYLSEEGLVGVKIALIALGIALLLEAISFFEGLPNWILGIIYLFCAIVIFISAWRIRKK